MADRGIIFSAPMVQALLAGRKTQTRRLFKPRGFRFYTHPVSGDRYEEYNRDGVTGGGQMHAFGWSEGLYSYLPYAPGDRLYVRENFQLLSFGDYLPTKHQPADVRFAATDPCADLSTEARGYPWRPCIHMPRWASRMTLLVSDVRVQRVQDISEAEARAEGVEPPEVDRDERNLSICPSCGGTGLHGALGANLGVMEVDCTDCDTHAKRFRHLWNSLHTAPGERWEDSPWIVAVTFSVVRENIDRIEA